VAFLVEYAIRTDSEPEIGADADHVKIVILQRLIV